MQNTVHFILQGKGGIGKTFVSSILAQSGSFSDHELTENDLPTPTDAYGRSKLAAEQAVSHSVNPTASPGQNA